MTTQWFVCECSQRLYSYKPKTRHNRCVSKPTVEEHPYSRRLFHNEESDLSLTTTDRHRKCITLSQGGRTSASGQGQPSAYFYKQSFLEQSHTHPVIYCQSGFQATPPAELSTSNNGLAASRPTLCTIWIFTEKFAEPYAKLEKPDIKGHILHSSVYMKF